MVLAIELLLHFGHHSKLIGDPNYYDSMINVFLGNQSVSTFIAYYNQLQPYGATGNQIFLAFFKRPLSPFLASLVCRITGVSVGTGFSIITALYTIGAIYLFYKFLISIGIDKKITFLTVLLFINAFPMLVLCATDMTDMGGYFFALLELYFVFKYCPQFEQKNWKYYVILGLINAIGMLARETVLFTLIFIAIFFCVQPVIAHAENKDWVKRTINAILYYLIPIVISAIIVLAWYIFGMQISPFSFQLSSISLRNLLDQSVMESIVFIILISFNFAFIYFIPGFFKEENKERIEMLLLYTGCMIPAMILQYYAVPFSNIPQYCLIFLIFPFFLPIAGYGMVELSHIFAGKPVLNKIPKTIWLTLFILLFIILNLALSVDYLSSPLLTILSNLSHGVL